MKELIRLAAEYGIQVHASHLPDDALGFYLHDEKRIYFDIRLTPNERRAVLAHELGHAHHGHSCDSEKHERQADTFAANLLIDPAEYAAAETVSSDSHHLADELGVTPDLIDHYRAHCIQRLGSRTYSTNQHSRLTSDLARRLS